MTARCGPELAIAASAVAAGGGAAVAGYALAGPAAIALVAMVSGMSRADPAPLPGAAAARRGAG